MELAQALLTDTNLPIAQIGYEIGFSDNHNFSSAFKKVTGQSPSAYRNSYAERMLFHQWGLSGLTFFFQLGLSRVHDIPQIFEIQNGGDDTYKRQQHGETADKISQNRSLLKKEQSQQLTLAECFAELGFKW